MYRREWMTGSPGNSPAQMRWAKSPPISGIDIATPYAIASPMPESRSSSSE